MSYEYTYHSPSSQSGRSETDFILATVKEQEIQFKRLTKELEEERNTVAHQLEQCKIAPSNDIDKSGHDDFEESDTESRRDSTNGIRKKISSHKSQVYQQLSPQRLKNEEVNTSANNNIQRRSPMKMFQYPDDVPHQQYSPGIHPGYKQRNIHIPTRRPGSLVHVEAPGSPPFPTYFSPPHVSYFPYYNHQQNVAYPHTPVDEFYPPLENDRFQAYPGVYNKPSSPAVFHFNQSYHGHPAVQSHLPQTFGNPHSAYHSRPIRNSSQAYAEQKISSQPAHHDQPPPVPPRDIPYQQAYNHHRDSSHYVKPTATRASFRQSKTSHAAISPVVQQRPDGDLYPRSVPLNRPSSNLNPLPHAESTPAYSPRSKPHDQQVAYAGSPRSHKPHLPPKNTSMSPAADPHLMEVIQKLKNPSYHVVASAAAYLQHVTFGSNKMKTVVRELGVIPILINLLHHHVLEVQLNACGALRNLVFGKRNDEAKLIVRNCGGVASLSHALRTATDQEMKEIISGVLWNLSSCDQLKTIISDSAMPVLASRVVIHYVSMLDPERMSRYQSDDDPDPPLNITRSDLTIDPGWSATFTNATGCLRNISSAGVDVRTKMRVHDGLVEALLLVIEHVIGRNDVDSKGVENCMCILRNLSYRLALEVEAANVPMKQDAVAEGCSKDDDCWRRHKKKEKRRSKDAENLLSASSKSSLQGSVHGVELLWQRGVVRRYLALLAETCNCGTLEAATGALQNLSAGHWEWSANIRVAVRKEKGLPMLVEFLRMDNVRIVAVMCSTLRNMAIDERNKQLIGKHAMANFVDLLPEPESISPEEAAQKVLDEQPSVASLQKVLLYEAACCALKELVTASLDNAMSLYNSGAVAKLIGISRGSGYQYPHRLVKAAGRVLAVLWEYKTLRSLFKEQGWTQFHFNLSGVPSMASVGSQVSPFSSPPLSPSDTNNEVNTHCPTYSNVPPQSSDRQRIQSSHALPYAPMSSKFFSQQPDANYVVLRKDDKQVLAESLV